MARIERVFEYVVSWRTNKSTKAKRYAKYSTAINAAHRLTDDGKTIGIAIARQYIPDKSVLLMSAIMLADNGAWNTIPLGKVSGSNTGLVFSDVSDYYDRHSEVIQRPMRRSAAQETASSAAQEPAQNVEILPFDELQETASSAAQEPAQEPASSAAQEPASSAAQEFIARAMRELEEMPQSLPEEYRANKAEEIERYKKAITAASEGSTALVRSAYHGYLAWRDNRMFEVFYCARDKAMRTDAGWYVRNVYDWMDCYPMFDSLADARSMLEKEL